jgi:hypothetical protein
MPYHTPGGRGEREKKGGEINRYDDFDPEKSINIRTKKNTDTACHVIKC